MCCMKYFTKSFLYYQQGHKSLMYGFPNYRIIMTVVKLIKASCNWFTFVIAFFFSGAGQAQRLLDLFHAQRS